MLDRLKLMLGFVDDDRNALLELIIGLTTKRLRQKLGGVESVPEELDYIVEEVSIIRFNRIGSEGLTSHTVEGESLTFSDNDFDGFKEDIQDYLNRKDENPKKGGFKFL